MYVCVSLLIKYQLLKGRDNVVLMFVAFMQFLEQDKSFDT